MSRSLAYELSLGSIKRSRKSKFNPDRKKINSATDDFLKNGGVIEKLPETISEHIFAIYKSPDRSH